MRDPSARSALDLARVCLSNINASRALFARDPLLAYFFDAMDRHARATVHRYINRARARDIAK
jgi:hypothetical protein